MSRIDPGVGLREELEELETKYYALVKQAKKLREELALVKRGVDRKDDIQGAVTDWLHSFGFSVYVELRHGPIGEVLSMLADGVISRSKAAEAIAELMVGGTPRLPDDRLSEFGEDEMPGEVVRKLREERDALAAALARIAAPLDCGCNPCRGQCQSELALKLIIEGLQDIATEALSGSKTILAARDARIRAESQEQINAFQSRVSRFEKAIGMQCWYEGGDYIDRTAIEAERLLAEQRKIGAVKALLKFEAQCAEECLPNHMAFGPLLESWQSKSSAGRWSCDFVALDNLRRNRRDGHRDCSRDQDDGRSICCAHRMRNHSAWCLDRRLLPSDPGLGVGVKQLATFKAWALHKKDDQDELCPWDASDEFHHYCLYRNRAGARRDCVKEWGEKVVRVRVTVEVIDK